MIVDPRFTKEVSAFVMTFAENDIYSYLSGDSVYFTLCDRTDTTSSLGNYFVSLNLPYKEDALPKYGSLSIFYPELQQLNVDKVVLVKIPPSGYTEYIDARSINLNVPVVPPGAPSTQIYKLFSSTYSGLENALKEGESSPLLGDNIAYLFSDSINLPYTGLSVSDMGQIIDNSVRSTWNSRLGDYEDRISAVSYQEVKQENNTINTDRRYRINKSVFVDGLYNDVRGMAVSYYDTNFVAGDVGFIVHPDFNVFRIGDSVTVDQFNHNLNPTYSGDCKITNITTIAAGLQGPFPDYMVPEYKGPWLRIETDLSYVNATSNESGTLYISGGTYYNYDIPVGFVVLDKGLIVITHKDIVDYVDWTTGFLSDGSPNVGGDTANVFFDATETTIYGDVETVSELKFTSVDTVFSMKATCNVLLGEFYISNNPTWNNRTTNNPLAEDDPVSITEIGFYNQMNELIAVSKLSEPVYKSATDLLTFEIEINL